MSGHFSTPGSGSGGTSSGSGSVASSVTVVNLPTVQPVSGTVALSGGTVGVTLANTASVAGTVSVSSVPNAGIGAMQAVSASSTNGTPIGTLPAGGSGVRIYLPVGASMTYTVATSAPTTAPTTFIISNSANGYNWDEPLSGGAMIYVTAYSGAPLFRWL